MVPYVGWSNDVVIERVLSGYRMPLPENCPNSLYDIMYECWNADPEKRPTFVQLAQKINGVVLEPVVQTENNNNVKVPHSENFYN